MSEVELDNITEIIARRIYHENIMFYENAIYNGSFVDDYVLTIDYDKIKEAIKNNEDLNQFGIINGVKCIETDLNDYFCKILEARIDSVSNWLSLVEYIEADEYLYKFVKLFLETHTEEENFYMKKLFLKRMNYSVIFEVESDEMEQIFYNQFVALKEAQENSLKLKK